MKTNNPGENDKALNRVLREWTVDAALPPRFQENVWARIEKAEITPQGNIWSGFKRWVESILPRPKVAFVYVTVLLLVGGVVGFWEGGVERSRADAALSSRYVQTIDPFRAVALNQ